MANFGTYTGDEAPFPLIAHPTPELNLVTSVTPLDFLNAQEWYKLNTAALEDWPRHFLTLAGEVDYGDGPETPQALEEIF